MKLKTTQTRRDFLSSIGKVTLASALPAWHAGCQQKKIQPEVLPNILWIYVEDLSPFMSCYGFDINPTPNIDRLAQDGVQFSKAFMPVPVCSPCRSSIITGTMATTFGLHNHHSSRSEESAIYLPEGVKTIPELFREAGYYTFNRGKDDYNFWYDREKLYSGKYTVHALYGKRGLEGDWKDRQPGQPFFGQIQLAGGKHIYGKQFEQKNKDPIDPAKVDIPPYYPDHPIMRKEIADHYDTARITDLEVGEIINQLKTDGLLENTVVFFFSDHGMRTLRHKQFCYDGGLHVPLTVTWYGNPQKIKAGKVRSDLINGIDIGTTSLALAGIDIPDYMEGNDLFAENYDPREYIIAARDRCDYTIDRIRAVRTAGFKYIRNFFTDRPYMQPNYRDAWDLTKTLKNLYKQGSLNKTQEAFLSDYRPAEELYDLKNDPHEINNLADDPNYIDVLHKHRNILDKWIKDFDDKGQYPESKVGLKFIYDWWGEKCVNPEYNIFKESSEIKK